MLAGKELLSFVSGVVVFLKPSFSFVSLHFAYAVVLLGDNLQAKKLSFLVKNTLQ